MNPTHCRGEDFDQRFAGSNPAGWYVEKDGNALSADISQVQGKIRVRIEGQLLVTGNSFTIYNDVAEPIATYDLIDC